MKLHFNGKKFIKSHTKETIKIIAEKFPCNSLFFGLGEYTLKANTSTHVYSCMSILLYVISKLG